MNMERELKGSEWGRRSFISQEQESISFDDHFCKQTTLLRVLGANGPHDDGFPRFIYPEM